LIVVAKPTTDTWPKDNFRLVVNLSAKEDFSATENEQETNVPRRTSLLARRTSLFAVLTIGVCKGHFFRRRRTNGSPASPGQNIGIDAGLFTPVRMVQ